MERPAKSLRATCHTSAGLVLALFALLLSTGGVRSQEFGREAETIISWAATCRLTLAEWSTGSVPTHFARRTIAASLAGAAEAFATLESSADEGEEAAKALVQRLGPMREAMRAAARLAENDDRQDAPATAGKLAELVQNAQVDGAGPAP